MAQGWHIPGDPHSRGSGARFSWSTRWYVRTSCNPILVEDLQANKTVFRRGSTMVKELYFDGEEEVVGYAVMTKVRKKSGDEGQVWLFYETFDGTNNGAIFGKGLEEWADCHSTGIEFLRSDFRP